MTRGRRRRADSVDDDEVKMTNMRMRMSMKKCAAGEGVEGGTGMMTS